ncbi:MAG: leucyl aminopeptidase [Saprospiraceae bacterium]|nr:leucyl aminopeptidase [Saprospiraceae bacterium]
MDIAVFDTLETLQQEALIIPMTGNGAHESTLAAIEKTIGVSATILKEDFKGELGEIHPLYLKNQRVYLLGLGPKPHFADVLKAFRSLSHKLRNKLPPKVGVSFLHHNLPDVPEQWVEATVNGLLLGTYYIGRYKTNPSEQHPFHQEGAAIRLFLEKNYFDKARSAIVKAQVTAETQMRIFDLVNAPSNKKVPSDLSDWAVESSKKYGYKVEIWGKEEIIANHLDALLAVNQGSDLPPAFIIMEYVPEGKPLRKVGFVGKGVTFDTGGLSIKPAANMHWMKSDMGGAAAVLGAIEVIAKRKLPFHVIGIIPATENTIDAKALKPSDVIGTYSGKTIEVIDTDAEGRLILADGLSYMVKNFQPDVLIDLATLTGSTVRTFGYHAAGLYSNNDELSAQLYQAGERSGERVWRLPIWDVYKEDIKSDVADVRNLSGKPVAGGISAAKFLEVFIDNHPAWAHLDIAGVAFGDSEFASQKNATAFGVRLLVEFLEELEKNI